MQPIGTHGGEVMCFGCVCFRDELDFLNCGDICMGVVNKQFELIEFVFDSVYVDRHFYLGAQCSILLHLIDICFLQWICLWQISHIQTCLCVVVGPGFVSTSPAFMRSSAIHPAGPQHAQKR